SSPRTMPTGPSGDVATPATASGSSGCRGATGNVNCPYPPCGCGCGCWGSGRTPYMLLPVGTGAGCCCVGGAGGTGGTPGCPCGAGWPPVPGCAQPCCCHCSVAAWVGAPGPGAPGPGRGGLRPTLRGCLLPALRVRGLLPAAVGVGLLPLLVGRGPLRRLGDRLLRGRRGRLGHAGGGRCLVVVGAGPGRDGARPRARFRRLTHVRNPSGHGADGVEATGARGTHARRHRRRGTPSGGGRGGRPNRHGRRSTPLASGNRPSDGGTPDRRHRPGRRPAVTRRAAPAQPVRP